jgi:hypothetical protein
MARMRIVALVVGVVLIAVAAVVVTNFGRNEAGDGCRDQVAVRGVIGSEKEAFFNDERVTDRLACLGFTVMVDSRGSREMLDTLTTDNHGYGFAFPSSTPTAQKILATLGLHDDIPLFSTPMAVATFRPVALALKRANIIQPGANGKDVLDIAALLTAARNGMTWDQVPGNREYTPHKAVLLSTTDPQDSNSAIMYLSIASQVANGGAIVTTPEQVRSVLPDLCRLIFYQGDKPETSQVLFDNYLVDGMGRTPMALIYEAQYLTKAPPPALTEDNEVLYPKPTVYSRHTLIPLSDNGRAVGMALRDDPELVRLATEHGFRPEKSTTAPAADRPVDVVESPSFDVLEEMLAALAPTSENATRCGR